MPFLSPYIRAHSYLIAYVKQSKNRFADNEVKTEVSFPVERKVCKLRSFLRCEGDVQVILSVKGLWDEFSSNTMEQDLINLAMQLLL